MTLDDLERPKRILAKTFLETTMTQTDTTDFCPRQFVTDLLIRICYGEATEKLVKWILAFTADADHERTAASGEHSEICVWQQEDENCHVSFNGL